MRGKPWVKEPDITTYLWKRLADKPLKSEINAQKPMLWSTPW